MVSTALIDCHLVRSGKLNTDADMSDLHADTHQVVGEDHPQATSDRHELMLHVSVERTVLKGPAAPLCDTPDGLDHALKQQLSQPHSYQAPFCGFECWYGQVHSSEWDMFQTCRTLHY
jgi:hypothetical protein